MTLLREISDTLGAYGWAIGVCLSTLVGGIIAFTADNMLKIIILSGFIIIILIIIFFSLVFKYYISDKYLRYKDTIPVELTQVLFERKIIFDNKSLGLETAWTESHRLLKNNMPSTNYSDFTVEYISDTDVPDLKNLVVTIDGHGFELTKEKVNAQYCATCKIDQNFNPADLHPSNLTEKQLNFTIPIDIAPSEQKSLRIMFESKAYTQALHQKTDYVSLRCTRLTDEMSFVLLLTEGMRENYYITKSDVRDQRRGGYMEFAIIDASKERMITAEKELIDTQHVPIWENDNVIWRIPHPKLGYDYKLYFMILPRKIPLSKLFNTSTTESGETGSTESDNANHSGKQS